MKIILSILLFIFIPITIFAQDELDDIFDDGVNNKDVQFLIGTDALTTIGGTANLYGQVNLYEKVGIQLGAGLIPFSYLLDVGNVFDLAEPSQLINKEVAFGTFYNYAFRYIPETVLGSFTTYYYFDFKRWKYQYEGDITNDYFRRKGNFGYGATLFLNNHIGFDAHMGLFLGREWREDGNDIKIGVDLITGFDLGFTVFFHF